MMLVVVLVIVALLVGFLCGMGRSRTPGQGRAAERRKDYFAVSTA